MSYIDQDGRDRNSNGTFGPGSFLGNPGDQYNAGINQSDNYFSAQSKMNIYQSSKTPTVYYILTPEQKRLQKADRLWFVISFATMFLAIQWAEVFFSFVYWASYGFKGHFILNSKWTPPNEMIYFLEFLAFVGIGVIATLFNKKQQTRSHYYNKYLVFMPGIALLELFANDNYHYWICFGSFVYFIVAIWLAYKNEKNKV